MRGRRAELVVLALLVAAASADIFNFDNYNVRGHGRDTRLGRRGSFVRVFEPGFCPLPIARLARPSIAPRCCCVAVWGLKLVHTLGECLM